MKQVLSHKKGIAENDGDGADNVSILDDSGDNGTEDSDLNRRQEKVKNKVELNGCIRNTTAACGNIATGLLLCLCWPLHFFELPQTI